MFSKRNGPNIVIMPVYVDDVSITGNNRNMIDELQLVLKKNFKMKDLGHLRYFLGLEVLKELL